MAIDTTELFTRLGLLFSAQGTANTAAGTTQPAAVQAYLDEFSPPTTDETDSLDRATTALETYQNSTASYCSSLRRAAVNLITATVEAESTLVAPTITQAITELINQMDDAGDSVDASSVAASASAITGSGDGVLVTSAKYTNGKACENLLGETITLTCSSNTTPETAIFDAVGEDSQANALFHNWPLGSGVNFSLSAVDALEDDILENGGFDLDEDVTNIPDGWTVSTGTVGTTLKMTNYETQTIAISGTPTSGTYQIRWQNQAGDTQSTVAINYNADGATVQTALRELVGLEDVEVTTTGTSPDYTHSIEFMNVAGNLNQVTISNNTTGATITPSTTTAGSANAYVRRALEFDSDGSQLTAIYQPVTLDTLTQYAVNLWALADVVPAAGVITIDLVDGIGGTVIQDDEGANNAFTINCATLTTSFVAKNGVFRTPTALPEIVHFRIRITTAISSGSSVFLDHLAMAEMAELYIGGPSAAIFSGATDFAEDDLFTITATNDRAGKFQEYFERNFSMRANGLVLPSNSAGSETISDTLIP